MRAAFYNARKNSRDNSQDNSPYEYFIKMNLSAMLNQTRNWMEQSSKREQHHVLIENHSMTLYNNSNDRIYIPTATGKIFHEDDSFVKVIMGPYGSGKSTLCQAHVVQSVCNMPRWSNGRRKARWAFVRNTSGELQSTTLQTWLAWFGDLGDIRKRQKPIMTYEHTFNDGHGLIELEIIFLALDRPDDVRKVKSLELTGVYLNELSELPSNALAHFKGRVNGRYPSRSFCPDPYWSGIIADTNPPEIDHWIYKDFEVAQVENYKIFHQPPGLLKADDGTWLRNPNADNSNNLSDDYYLKLAEGQTEDFVKVFCLGEYGSVGFGKKVYPEFNDSLHVVEDIEAIQGEPIHLGWDGGLTPACVVIQMSERGQFRVLKEYCGEDMGIRTFAESVVIPSLARDFPYCKIGTSVFDPSGSRRDDIIEEMSVIGELNSLGIKTEGGRTNEIDVRLAAVRYFLNRMADGKPSFILSKKGCPMLRKGFIKDYVYKRIAVGGEERYKDKPDKNMASHPHDCLQYIAMEFASDQIAKAKAPREHVDMFNPTFQWQS